MNPNYLYARPGDWTWVAAVLGEVATHYLNCAGNIVILVIIENILRKLLTVF